MVKNALKMLQLRPFQKLRCAPYKHWAGIFNNDAGITAAILDRLLHRTQTVVIEGKSYRMKDRLTDEPAS